MIVGTLGKPQSLRIIDGRPEYHTLFIVGNRRREVIGAGERISSSRRRVRKIRRDPLVIESRCLCAADVAVQSILQTINIISVGGGNRGKGNAIEIRAIKGSVPTGGGP